MIVLYGLIDRQAMRMEKEFPSVLLWPRKRLISSLLGVDAVVLCVKFCGHTEQDRVLGLYGRNRVHLVYGGESAVRRKLRELTRRADANPVC